ncbi:unnamed protein product [Adineta ricciae]|uniref:Uncharacterized protein n=1 Tax=Adineta ricciae TaxID=249248 RepID=A0A815HAD8_ADIRI|nr:unnamed protein product [Adineta ricciae]CAF1532017.1 unnamed protein product [Adineta ricciae]
MNTNRIRKLVDLTKTFNLYKENEKLSYIDQITSTRLFTLSLFSSILIIILFTSLISQTNLVIVHTPSEDIYKQFSIKYRQTFSCLCQQSSINQGEIVSFNPEYHPICSSQFIDEAFLLSLTDIDVSKYWPIDYRLMVSSHVQLIQIFCRMIKEKLSIVLQEFSSQYVITTQALSVENFQSQISTLVNQFQKNTITAQKHINNFIWFNIFYNRMYPGLRSCNYMRYILNSSTILTQLYGNVSTYCSCRKDDECTYPAYIYNNTGRIGINGVSLYGTFDNDSNLLFILPNTKIGCFPYNSLLNSTLECFSDQLCLNSLQKFIPGFALVSPVELSRYSAETSINDLLNNLFLESWNEIYNFSKYYETCSPKLCTYSFDRSFNILYIIVTVFSLFGGLKVVLFLLTPIFIQCIRKIEKSFSRTDQTTTNIRRNENQNLKNRVLSTCRTVLQEIQTYNMFPLFNDIKDGIYSTRLYISVLTFGLISLIFYSFVLTQLRSITINNPSFNAYQQLVEKYSSKLTCPCSQISIKYASIIDINATLHQVCSSDFIKDDVWLLYNANLVGIFPLNDFRTTGMGSFRILQKLCILSYETITNELNVFNNMQFFTSQVTTNDTFNIQLSSIIEQFKRQTVDSFHDLFEMIQTSIRVNHLLNPASADATTIFLSLNGSTQVFFESKRVFDDPNCSCAINGFCRTETVFNCIGSCLRNESGYNLSAPDWFASCSPVDSLSISSLTCFYNSTCVQMLIDAYPLGMSRITLNPRAANVTTLNPMIKSRFTPSTRLDEIISELFIEEWTHSMSFHKYFEECSPNICVFTYEQRFSTSYMIATVTGFIGGLSVALKILIPLLVKFIRRISRYFCTTNKRIENEQNFTRKLATFLFQCQDSLKQMNFYHGSQSECDISLIKQQSIATRLYTLFFVLSISILLIFLNLDTRINLTNISSPSLSTFEYLQSKYSSTLICPCSNIAILYSAFVSIRPSTYHQICSTDFISLDFITLLWGKETQEEYMTNYDRKNLAGLFYALSSFCTLAQTTVERNMKTLAAKQLITLKTLTYDSFQSQVDSIVKNFIVETLAHFQWIHHFITEMFHANQLQHKFNLNWQSFAPNSQINYEIESFPIWFNESGQSCVCTTSPSRCFRSLLTIYNQTIRIPGVFFGCLPIDGLRRSTLDCFYNLTCLSRIASFFNITSNFPNALNQYMPTRFNPLLSVTFGELIDELFVETWQNSSNYSNYYSSCSPSSCEYSSVERNSILYMITTFLGLYGGLTIGLKVFAWYSLRLYWHTCRHITIRCRRNQVVPLNSN